ncbi:glycosyltransferase [Pseudomonas entomophila]|uniref:glycosyltransferase n=1 Tax=Pseudomonas entomophila TaxID=312306 RepID=UPI0024069888|nr:glycosyltransferase [Pseudomonas entomophila]MDF9616627.1 glycosyltransferase [Pseudomonas entomophila]
MSNAAQLDAHSLEQALTRLRLMFAKPEHPYYLLAPAYRDTSSGIVSMHYLCHMLNLSGREAYICGTDVVNPDLKTPLHDPLVVQRHLAQGKVPIAIYPEVTSGNPLGCSVVARYMLNFESFITGKGMEATADDLIFYYAERLAEARGDVNVDLLCLPALDISLFTAAPPGTVREGAYLYQNRHPLEQIDYTQLPADIQLLRVANALTLPELAEVFRRAEVLYTYEWSMTCVIAALCGCPVIFMPGYGVDQQVLDTSFFGSVGFAMFDQPDALELARASVGGALPRYVERTASFWQQLDTFIAKTQAAASREAAGNRRGMLDWLRQRYPRPGQLTRLSECLAGPQAPSLSLLVLDRGDQAGLLHTLESLDRGLYRNLQVHVLGERDPGRVNVQWLACDPRQPLPAINAVLERSTGDWCMLVEAGETFIASGLLAMAVNLLDAPPGCLAVYGDEALRQADGVVDIALRPDLNLDLLLANPAGLSRHWLYRRDALLQAGGFKEGHGLAFELGYQLGLLCEQGLGCVGHVAEPLLIAQAGQAQVAGDERLVIEQHLDMRGYAQAAVIAQEGGYRIDYGHARQASVSILVHLDGQLVQFQRCLESLLTQTTHPEYEVLLVEPGSDDPALLEWLEMVERIGEGRFQVLRFMPGQPRAALLNAAAQEARGEYLVWLDGRNAVLDGDWLPALLNHGQRAEVGAVGGKLLGGDGVVRQAGLVLGLAGSAAGAFSGLPAQAAGYMGRLGFDQNCSAVGGGCLMLRRELFLEAGGFDTDPLLEPWIDVDLCLRLREAGYLNVFTPYARLLSEAPLAARASAEQEDALYARWLAQLAHDPAYNSNLSLRRGKGFDLDSNDLSWHPLQGRATRVLACVAEQPGEALARLVHPLAALCEGGQAEGAAITGLLTPVELQRFAPTSVVLQRPLDDAGLLALRRLSAFSQAFKVYDLDGYLPEMGLAADFDAEQWLQRLRIGLMQVDRVLVPTPALAELLQGQHDDVRVMEAGLPDSWGRLKGERRVSALPRLGWQAGKDDALLAEVVPALAGEVEWVVLGECPANLRPFVSEVRPQVEPYQLGMALADLNLDLALVPMAQSLGNACSGDMRILQHAACGHPVICSRVPGFTGGDALPLSRVDNQAGDWLQAIRLHLSDRDASAALGDALQAAVRSQWLLEGERLDAWRRAWLPD